MYELVHQREIIFSKQQCKFTYVDRAHIIYIMAFQLYHSMLQEKLKYT